MNNNNCIVLRNWKWSNNFKCQIKIKQSCYFLNNYLKYLMIFNTEYVRGN